jgi:hypothetical protein
LVEGVEHAAPLAAAADHRRTRALRPPLRVGGDGPKAEGLERRALALDRQRGDRLRVHRVTYEAERVVPEQDVSGACRLLEPGGDVHGVARREGAAGRGRARDGLAGVDPDAHRELDTALVAQLAAQGRDLVAHLRRRPHGAQGVVLMHDRDPEDPHDRVADEVLDRPAVALDGVAHPPEPPLHRPAQRLGIHPLSKRRRSHDVRKDHRDDFPPLGSCRCRRHRRSTGGAEPRSLGKPVATARARLHDPSLERP